MSSKYKHLAEVIIENIGGKENIISLQHCFTRLRFKLKDDSIAKSDVLSNTEGIVNIVKSGGQFQIVIGTHVAEVYKAVCDTAGIAQIMTNTSDAEEKDQKPKGALNQFIDLISGIFLPVLGLLCACGMMKGLLVILTTIGILSDTDGTYQILYAIGDCIFYFFPVFLGYTAAKKFKCSEVIGIAIGTIMIYPNLIALLGQDPIFTVFEGTVLESDIFVTFLKIPVILNNYTSTVIPVILAVWFGAKVEKFAKSITPSVVKTFFAPFLTLLITIPVTLIVLGPIATWISNLLGATALQIYEFSPVLFGLFIGGFWQIFVIFGVHNGFFPIVINNLATQGYDPVFAATIAGCFTQLAILLAILIKTKDQKLRSLSSSALFSSIFGITEPAIYSVTLPLKKPFIISCIASAVGGAIAVGGGTKYFNLGGQGIFAFPCYMNPDGSMTSIMMSFVAVGVSMVIAFVATLVIFKDKPISKN